MYMAVVDISSAYRSVNVYPDHSNFQGIMWPDADGNETYYKDNCLAFGARSSPYIFQMLSDFVVRCMRRRGFLGTYGYSDDFIVMGENLDECNLALGVLMRLLRYLGFHLSYPKIVMPAQSVVYLGIQIDTVAMQLSLPPDKLTNLNNVVLEFSVKTKATKKELQVLAGHLSHAATVVSGGRTFSRRVINVIKRLPDSHVKVPLPSWFFDDIKWCHKFLEGRDEVFTADSGRKSWDEDFSIQVCCNHTIMSFGTFGWWMAFLTKG